MSTTATRTSPALRSRTVAIVAAWLATRLVMGAALLLAMRQSGLTPARALGNWDVQHYMLIATSGYADPKEMAFFPALPMVMRLLDAVGVPMAIGAAAVSQLASLVAAFAMERLGGLNAAIVWLLAPMAVFTTVGYTEALFCAVAFWAWVLARRGRWGWVAVLASVACLTRISGLFLVGGLGLLALFGGEPTVAGAEPAKRVGSWSQRLRNLAWLVVPLAVLAAFAVYLYTLSGHWDSWLSAQRAGWQREWTSPWDSLHNTLAATNEARWPTETTRAWIFRFEIISMAIGCLTALGCLVRRAWAQAGYVAVQVFAFSIATWFMSVNRADLLWFPLFIGVGSWLGRRPHGATARTVRTAVVGVLIAADLLLMFWWARLFYLGHWAS
ncbi:mannosyltransferase family protein [Propionibacterium freudenreichii]|uniref:mannosyltransferase family protein n=1 Tax=Propionibacterium freudenreichii TaxID=1744 RepID=UPI0022FD9136|nr:mannosyltransferase family protein [Propionibacterium freudenreichii]